MTPVFGQGTLPAQVQDILQAQIAAFDHQIQQHNHHFQNLTSATPPAPGTPGLPGARVPSPAAMHAQAFQQFVNQGQRARAAAGMHGVANNPGQGNGMGAPAGGGHLWLLVRLLGFVFFFTGGSGWRRTAMILLGALLVFLAQTPLFAGAFQGVWGPIRRHLDNLLPPANPAVPPAAAGAGAAARQGAGQAPTPAVTAARLMRQRQRELEERGWFRERALQIERALVLLFASLVPGVGERHVAARDAEAAAAAAAAAAAEEERRRGEAARSTEAAGTVESSENGEGSAAAEGQGRAQEAAL
ncbi:MAG: hypothetical protein M1832_005037 [Thelocarpon impressellum]|nr:MAG: hypothetical protein M1832_005037 [Thelocarpon impressellum]